MAGNERGGKSIAVAYLLLATMGLVGGHRFYLGRMVSGVMQLSLMGASLVPKQPVFTVLPLLWLLVDAFLIPGYVRTAAPPRVAKDDEAKNPPRRMASGPVDLEQLNAAFDAAFGRGNLADAARIGAQALEAARTLAGGKPNEALIDYLSNLGEVYRQMGRPNRALPLQEEALAMGQKLNLSIPSLSFVMNNLALAYQGCNQFVEAERLYLKLQAEASRSGNTGNSELQLLNNLANLYLSMGKPAEAELSFGKAVAMIPQVADLDPELQTQVLNNFASAVLDRQAYDPSRQLYQQALEVQERVNKGVSREAARSHNDLGVMAERLGQYAVAQRHLERALQLKRLCTPDDALGIANAEHKLGSVYFAQGNYAEAGRIARGLVETYTRLFGENHPNTQGARTNLAAIPSATVT